MQKVDATLIHVTRVRKGWVTPLPYEQREWIRRNEIPSYLMHFYCISLTMPTITKWMTQGVPVKEDRKLPKDQRRMVRLLATKRLNRWMVRRVDLEAFLNVY